MSYNGSGTFNINSTGQPVVAGTVITASAFNALTTDLATGLTTAITKDGQTTTTARITFAQGFTSSLVTDSSSVSTGSIITDGGMGVAKNLYVGGTLNVTGSTSLTNPVINNIKMGYTTTATAAGTTTLTVSSNYRQFFTGSTTQTIVLPVTSTLVTGMAYEIENNSTGLLTVNSSGGNLVGTIPAGVCAHAVCIGTTLTTAADWDWDYISTTTITGTGANVLGTSPTITSPTLVTPALGTPASGTLTNCTGLPTSALTGSISEANGGTGTTTGYYGFKNRIINGGQVINQRNATVTTASTYVTDRWQVDNLTTSGAVSFAQNSTAPAGFTNSLKITVTTADAAVAASDIVEFRQWIEGYNTADFSFGSASAGTFTVSFWVNSSVTGTYGVSFRNSASDRVYVSTYTISAANTWEQKTITVAGDTTGTWLTDNGRGLGITFCVMGGSNFQGTAGAWGATNNRTTSAQANLLATISNTFYITGVQLEKGSTATSFDYRPYGTELALCQRYFQKVSGSINGSAYQFFAVLTYENASNCFGAIALRATMRTQPTTTYSGSFSLSYGTLGTLINDTNQTGGDVALVGFNSGSGGAAGSSTYFRANNSSATFISFSAEL